MIQLLHNKRFERIYKAYYMRLYCYAMGIVGDPDICRDLVNEVFTRLWVKIADIDEIRIYSYLARAIYHGAVDHLRNEVKQREYRDDYLKSASEADTDYSEELEKDKMIYRLLAGLKPPADKIVELKYFNGMKYEEIATELNMSINTVKKHLVKSLKKLREISFREKHTRN